MSHDLQFKWEYVGHENHRESRMFASGRPTFQGCRVYVEAFEVHETEEGMEAANPDDADTLEALMVILGDEPSTFEYEGRRYVLCIVPAPN